MVAANELVRRTLRWVLVAALLVIVVVAPVVFYRSVYAHSKRLREIVPGRVYRSGQLTQEGFADAVRRLHLRTFINLQDDFPDPAINRGYWDRSTIEESELCRRLGVRYVFIAPDLVSRRADPGRRPEAIDELLDVLDDETSYPVLIHCKAGLHRTGVLAAVYRMEYQGWSPALAYKELKGHGFGDWDCTAANEYVKQYVLTYQRGLRRHHQGPETQNAE
jgi:protein-tyrosine phosphatase